MIHFHLKHIARYGKGRKTLGMGLIATTVLRSGSAIATRSMSSAGSQHSTTYKALSELNDRIQSNHSLRIAHQQHQGDNSDPQLQSDLAKEILRTYSKLDPLKLPLSDECERCNILHFLSLNCSPKEDKLQNAVDRVVGKESGIPLKPKRFHALAIANLRQASTPSYEGLLEYVLKCDVKQGIKFLLELRSDILRAKRWIRASSRYDERFPYIEELDAYLFRLFTVWFSPGMLYLERITYEESSASVIEFIATKEAVHPMKSLDDLRNRLGAGRRVFALFHPLIENYPLAFVHVALTSSVPHLMTGVMGINPCETPTCATFYSITNAQSGLAGIGLGEHLLKESVEMLQREFVSVETFATLSPIPNFRKWLEEKCLQNDEHGTFFDDSILPARDWEVLSNLGLVSNNGVPRWRSFLECLDTIDFSPNTGNQEHLTVLRPILMKLAARYLVLEKHRGKPLDGVARFHLGNGAMLHRINFAADLTRKGLRNSFGMMVNYRYILDEIDVNRRCFEGGCNIQASDDVLDLLDNGDREQRSKL